MTMPLLTAILTGVRGRVTRCAAEEVLAKQPARTGGHWWLRVGRTGLSTSQAKAAVARAAQIDEALVSHAGARDRQARLVQWFSVPVDAVDNPGALKGAGAQGKMRVLEVTRSHKPITPATISGLSWTLTIAGAAKGEGYRNARQVMDHLRRQGLPNRIGRERLGPEGSLARYGQMMLSGARLPAAARAEPGACLLAVQAWLFNRYLDARISDGLFDRALEGDVVRTSGGEELLTGDAVAMQRRFDSFECQPLGPLFGDGMIPAAGEAAAREDATLAAAGLTRAQAARLHGGRRALRVQPTQVVVDLSGDDLLLTCTLPVETYLSCLLEELIRDEVVPTEFDD